MPSTSAAQQRFMGAALAAKRGGRAISGKVAKAAHGMSEKQLKDFARKSKRKSRRKGRS